MPGVRLNQAGSSASRLWVLTVAMAYFAQTQTPSAQQSPLQPQSPVQTPVSQQPQSHVAQQQFAGQVPAQQLARVASAGAKNDIASKVRNNMRKAPEWLKNLLNKIGSRQPCVASQSTAIRAGRSLAETIAR